MITSCVLPIKGIVLVVNITLVKPNVTHKLDGMNKIKVQEHQNTLEAKSTTVLHGLLFQMVQKMLRSGKI